MSSDIWLTALPPHYQFTKTLGEGGMGEVIQARDTRLDRFVAIKTIKRLEVDDAAAVALNEAKALAKTSHANLVQIHDIIERNDNTLLVMEYVDGLPLSRYVQQNVLTQLDKLHLLKQIAQGLYAAHQQKVVHCDLKFDNVLVSANGLVKIADFGIARLNQQKSMQQTLSFGCRDVLAPEILAGKVFDHRADLFSLGILAYKLFTGHHPFNKESVGRWQRTTDHLHRHEHVLHPQLIRLIESLLHFDIELRPCHAQHVADSLGSIIVAIQEAEQQQETLPLSNGSQTSHRLGQLKRRLVAGVFLCFMVLGITYWLYLAPPMRYLLVLQPQINGSTAHLKQTEFLPQTVDDAIRQFVIASDHLALIPATEYNKSDKDIHQLVTSTGATDVITSDIACQQTACQVTLHWLSGERLVVTKQASWHVNKQRLLETFYTTLEQANKLHGDINSKIEYNQQITDQDYVTYLRIKEQMQHSSFSDSNIEQLAKLLGQSPYLFPAYHLFREASLNRYHQEKDPQVLRRLKEILRQAPSTYKETPLYHLDLANIAIASKNEQSFSHELNHAQKKGMGREVMAVTRAQWYMTMGQYDKANAQLNIALSYRRNHANLINQAYNYYFDNKFQLAIKALNEVLSDDASQTSANSLLATIYLSSGEPAKAIPYYKQLTQDSPEPYDLNNLALAYMLDQDLPSAYQAIKRIDNIELDLGAWLNLADIEAMLGNVESARYHYQQIVNRAEKSDDPDTLIIKAQAYAHLAQYNAALFALNSAIKMAPDNASYVYTAALVHTLAGEYMSASVSVAQSLKQGYGTVWFTLPWFKPLCQEPMFVEMLDANALQNLCNYDA